MAMQHVTIWIDGRALCVGAGVILVALLSWERSGTRWLRDLAFLLSGATALLLLDVFRNYALITGWPQGAARATWR